MRSADRLSLNPIGDVTFGKYDVLRHMILSHLVPDKIWYNLIWSSKVRIVICQKSSLQATKSK